MNNRDETISDNSPDGTYRGEKFPYLESCQACGLSIVMGHMEPEVTVQNGKVRSEKNVVVDHNMSIPGPCTETHDGRHIVTGM